MRESWASFVIIICGKHSPYLTTFIIIICGETTTHGVEVQLRTELLDYIRHFYNNNLWEKISHSRFRLGYFLNFDLVGINVDDDLYILAGIISQTWL